ncbi:hypothetical protein Pint_07165 [Pistacia integerrima]|uniref:Uncharacterized protein n=1 Tax=Pistacia integerrima TaxID=434235 RepID=A0ACC0XXT1_9ROSI|nr:hypothetical protein Pint_07165 [Pistacia integerrima]
MSHLMCCEHESKAFLFKAGYLGVRWTFPPLRLVYFLRYSIRWHVRSHTKERLDGQSLMNSFSNHYWNLASRKSSLKQVAMRQGHFFPLLVKGQPT